MAVETGCITLNTGASLPIIGLGTWKSKAGEVQRAVEWAIAEGYRHIDCAKAYGNEAEVGKGVAAKIQDGTVKRSELFITSKLAPTYNEPPMVEQGCRESLRDLGLDYLDLYLIHWPVALKDGKLLEDSGVQVCYTETWKSMETLVEKGMVKAIGVSNFNKNQLENLLAMAKIRPAVNQVEVHPYLNNAKLVDYCASQGIVVTAHAPFASPDPGRPTRKEDDPKPLEDPVIKKIAQKYNAASGQIILKWLNQRGLVAIPKSVNQERIKININIKHFQLTADEIAQINGLNIPFRACYGAPFVKSKNYPFNDEY